MIKEFSLFDLEKCCKLFIDVFNKPPWDDEWTNKTASAYLQELVDYKRFLGYTLWDNDLLIGAVFCHIKSHYRGEEVFVDEIFVKPENQRKGYGTKLMNEIENYAKNNSFISITLLTGKSNPAFDFYSKFGWKHLDYLAFIYKRIK